MMNFDVTASMWLPSPTRRPAVTVTFDLYLHNIIMLSVRANEYPLLVLSKLFKAFMRYRGNNICPDERTK